MRRIRGNDAYIICNETEISILNQTINQSVLEQNNTFISNEFQDYSKSPCKPQHIKMRK